MNMDYLLRYISYELHTIVKSWSHPVQRNSIPKVFCGRNDLKDLYFSTENLCLFLSGKKDSLPSSVPVLFSVNEKIYFAFIPSSKQDFLIGPVTFSVPVRLNFNIPDFPVSESYQKAVAACTFSDFSKQLLLLYNLLHTDCITLDDLVTVNCMDSSINRAIMQEYSTLVFNFHENKLSHNPYDQEVREFSSIQQGDIEMLKKSLQENYVGKIGTLADNEVRHMRNRGIVVITLASRAAIRGGLLPETAFSMSDVFIRKIEEESDTVVLLNMIHLFEFKFAEMVAEINSRKKGKIQTNPNPRIEQCKDYIFKHLHEKIRIQDIAGHLFLNANYLSEIFRKQEGTTITDFILREKVALTKNLLSYSPYSYSEIATYLGFSSQSHLGKVFKKYVGLTLHQYRNQYHVKDPHEIIDKEREFLK